MAPEVAAAHAGSVPDVPRTGFIVRVLGIYIAGAAGSIQLLDVVVDRTALPERVFAFAVVVAIVGLPVAVLSAFLTQISAAEKRRPRNSGPADPSPTRGATARVSSVIPAGASDTAARVGGNADLASTLTHRLQLALSYRRLAMLHRETGSEEEAAPHSARFVAEFEQLINELHNLADSERERLKSGSDTQ